jgi:hypothetical protein
METIDDIVADIRAQNQGLPEDANALSPLVCDLLSLADRIEKAYQEIIEYAVISYTQYGTLFQEGFFNTREEAEEFLRIRKDAFAIGGRKGKVIENIKGRKIWGEMWTLEPRARI